MPIYKGKEGDVALDFQAKRAGPRLKDRPETDVRITPELDS